MEKLRDIFISLSIENLKRLTEEETCVRLKSFYQNTLCKAKQQYPLEHLAGQIKTN